MIGAIAQLLAAVYPSLTASEAIARFNNSALLAQPAPQQTHAPYPYAQRAPRPCGDIGRHLRDYRNGYGCVHQGAVSRLYCRYLGNPLLAYGFFLIVFLLRQSHLELES
jgi:hypothetical protein